MKWTQELWDAFESGMKFQQSAMEYQGLTKNRKIILSEPDGPAGKITIQEIWHESMTHVHPLLILMENPGEAYQEWTPGNIAASMWDIADGEREEQERERSGDDEYLHKHCF